MPLRHSTPPVPPADPAEWRPQQFGHGSRPLEESVVEPRWNGVRVLAHFDGTATRFIDEEGDDCTDEFAEVAAAVTAAALAGDMILDGHLTVEATQSGTGDPDMGIATPTPGQMMTQMIVGSRGVRAAEPKYRLDPTAPIAFVAVDLLRIDGSSLLDIPLLERKRLLDGALRQSELVRATPFVRQPIGSFVSTWRGAGFNGLVYKGANSRYLPGVRNDDWTAVPMPIK